MRRQAAHCGACRRTPVPGEFVHRLADQRVVCSLCLAKLPEFARGLGKTMREFKKAAAGVTHVLVAHRHAPWLERMAGPRVAFDLHASDASTVVEVRAADGVLSEIEQRLSWRPRPRRCNPHSPPVTRRPPRPCRARTSPKPS